MKTKAIKKGQICVDKILDLMEIINDDVTLGEIQRILDALNNMESRIGTLDNTQFSKP